MRNLTDSIAVFDPVIRKAVNFPVVKPSRALCWLLSASLLSVTGCAFDLSHVKQQPTTYTAVTAATEGFILERDVKATLGTGFPARLKAGTRWRQVGETGHGAVFATKDQIVTVEASNIFEAQIVVSNKFINGFYLPVEKTFAPVKTPIRIETRRLATNQP